MNANHQFSEQNLNFFTNCQSSEKSVNFVPNYQSFDSNLLKKDTYKKPHRFCPFCEELNSKLTRHIRAKHSNVLEVKEAMNLPRELMLKKFSDFKKQGMYKYNKGSLNLSVDTKYLMRMKKGKKMTN